MINYSNEGIWGVFLCTNFTNGSVVPQAMLMALPSGLLTVAIMVMNEWWDFWQDNAGTEEILATQLWPAAAATVTFLLAFRTNKAYARFWDGTTLLHQMFGEWFDATSCLIAFTCLSMRNSASRMDVLDFRHTLVRLMSLCHASALEEMAELDYADIGYPVLDIGGLDEATLRYLRDCQYDPNLMFPRVEVVIHMIQTLIVNYQATGIIKIPPPILSRVFQTLSRGQVNLANCKKITATLFPFPFTQLIAFCLFTFSILTPIAMSSLLKGSESVSKPWMIWWAFCFTLLPLFGLWALNFIARELEMPFGNDPNDLPLLQFHQQMNTSLLMLIREEADIVPHIDPHKCQMSYDLIKANMSTQRPDEYTDPRESHFCEKRVSETSRKNLRRQRAMRSSAMALNAQLSAFADGANPLHLNSKLIGGAERLIGRTLSSPAPPQLPTVDKSDSQAGLSMTSVSWTAEESLGIGMSNGDLVDSVLEAAPSEPKPSIPQPTPLLYKERTSGGIHRRSESLQEAVKLLDRQVRQNRAVMAEFVKATQKLIPLLPREGSTFSGGINILQELTQQSEWESLETVMPYLHDKPVEAQNASSCFGSRAAGASSSGCGICDGRVVKRI